MSSPQGEIFAPLGTALTRTDLVIEAVRNAILSGNLKPGAALVERTLAEELKVSKTPVREALIALARNGLIDMTRNRGATVRELTVQDVLDVYQARLLLEPWAIFEAVQRGIPQSSLEQAEDLLNQSDAAGGEQAQAIRAQANRNFHRIMVKHSGNPLIINAIEQVQDLAALGATAFIWPTSPTWEKESQEHRAILAAAQAQDADKAKGLLETHIQTSIQRIVDLQK